jgi:hypothetical protein
LNSTSAQTATTKNRSYLDSLYNDLDRASHWNRYERFGSGWFAKTQPPMETAHIIAQIDQLEANLTREREDISKLSEGTLKP